MGSFDRSKKRVQLWKRAILHFALCFVMGFFSGFAPTSSTTSLFSTQTAIPYKPINNIDFSIDHHTLNRSLLSDIPTTDTEHLPLSTEDESPEPNLRGQLIIVTTTRSGDPFQGTLLTRLASTLRLVPPPLLWIIVEARPDAPKTDELLRKTGVVYRHLTFNGNFTDADAEADHQRNVALNHVEFHRLDGIVHFAGVSNTYELEFFEEIRDIEVFGTWPVAMLSSNRKRVVVEGPICSSSKVVGWQWGDFSNGTTYSKTPMTSMNINNGTNDATPSTINISGFGFNSSILWDPERWGRPSSVPDTSQDSIKFVQQVVMEDEAKLRAIPPDCSRIMAWHLHVPRTSPIQANWKR